MTPPDRERRAREEAEAREREARANAVRRIDDVGMCRFGDAGVRLATKVAAYESLDAYAEAVRQAERDRMARVVEQLDGYSHQFDPDNICMQPEDDGPYLLRDDVLTALAAPPEGKTDGQ